MRLTVLDVPPPPGDGAVRERAAGPVERGTWGRQGRRAAIQPRLEHDRKIEEERAPRAEEVGEGTQEVVRVLVRLDRHEENAGHVERVAEEREEEEKNREALDTLARELT